MSFKLEEWELILLFIADVCWVGIELERLNWASWFIVDLVVSWQSRCGKQENRGSCAIPSNHWCKSLRVGLFIEHFDQVLSYQHQLKTWMWALLTGKRAHSSFLVRKKDSNNLCVHKKSLQEPSWRNRKDRGGIEQKPRAGDLRQITVGTFLALWNAPVWIIVSRPPLDMQFI